MEQDLSAVLDDTEDYSRRSKSPTSIRSRTPYERPTSGGAAGGDGDVAMSHDEAGAGTALGNANNGAGANVSGGASKKDCRVYVGNLAYEVGWQDLKDYMRKAGEVLFADILTLPGGRSKGCGVVEYATPEEASRAISELNDTPLMGRQVFVREDREAEAKFGASGGGGGGGGRGPPRSGNGVFVGNLPYIVAWQDLKDLFRQAGNVIRSDIHEGPDRRSKGTGVVVFDNATDAQNAISMFNGYDWHGRKIEVREDHGSYGGGGAGEFSRAPMRPGGRGACYKCGREGHIARECPDGPGMGGGGMGRGGPYGGAPGGYGRDYPPRRDPYYDQGRGYGGGGYGERMYGGARMAPYGYDRGGYEDYYGRGGYGGAPGGPGPRDPYYRGPAAPYEYRQGGPMGGMNPAAAGGAPGQPYGDYPPPGRDYPPPGTSGSYGDYR